VVRHHVVVASWEQGGRRGDPYTRLYEVRCDPCKWRSQHTDQQWQARRWADDHQGLDRSAAPWARGPGAT